MSQKHQSTPEPNTARSEIASVAYRVAEEVVERSESQHMRRCETDPTGPVCRVLGRMDDMDARIGTIETALAEDRGGRKRTAWVFAVLSVLIGGGTLGIQMLGLHRRDAQAADNAAIVQQLRELKAELAGKGH